ncbi:MAG TPA: preprotein translocase subunit SecE [Candidatus Hydrogenedentes bacterium]|nr:preprotein translocase subunit SecE [Candidatus Hydrogenedentota bacterium]
MAKQGTLGSAKPSPLARGKEFFNEVVVEMKKVAWPSKDELKVSTSVVLMLLAFVAVVVGLYDFVFQKVVYDFGFQRILPFLLGQG